METCKRVYRILKDIYVIRISLKKPKSRRANQIHTKERNLIKNYTNLREIEAQDLKDSVIVSYQPTLSAKNQKRT